jgi:hypothetical protein
MDRSKCERRITQKAFRLLFESGHAGGPRTQLQITLDDQGPAIFRDLPEFLALGEALDRLAQLNPRQAQVVELHSFAGLTEEEAAKVLDVVSSSANWTRPADTDLARDNWKPGKTQTRKRALAERLAPSSKMASSVFSSGWRVSNCWAVPRPHAA